MTWLLLLLLSQGRGDLTHIGNEWAWSKSGEAFVPQLVMYATPPHFYESPAKIDRDIETFLIGHGFNGFHVFLSCRWFDIEEEDCRRIEGSDPELDPRVFDALELLIGKTYQAGGMVHLWMWGDEQRGQTPSARADWGGLGGPVARKVEREIARRLGALPGWSLGYGFDLEEWVEAEQIEEFRSRLQTLLPRFHFLGGRPGGPNHGSDHRAYGEWNRGLDYASYEHHRPTYAVYVAALTENPDKPVLSEDRFRVMASSDSKHYSLEDVRRGLWHSTLAGGVGNIWGYLLDGGSHDLGSAPFPNREAIRTHFEFLRGRFSQGMSRCSPDRSEPAESPLCLARGPRVLLYKEDAARVELPIESLEARAPAIAVDTRRAYHEIDVGVLHPGRGVWEAPYESDWALAVGDFAERSQPSMQPSAAAPPSAPRVRAASSAAIELEWTVAVEGEGGFELERAESGDQVPGEFRRLATLPGARTRFVDTDVSPGRGYWYRVRAAGSSIYSENLRVFVGTGELVISELRPASLSPAFLGAGDRYYADRDYRLVSVPSELTGAVWIPTVNDEKLAETERFLSFMTSRPTTVYVGFDPRATKPPDWLDGWTRTAAKIEVAGEVIRRFDVYRRDYEPGSVILGATSAHGADWGDRGRSHYVVALKPR